MCATFSNDDLEKTVENANGEEIGIVTAVEAEGDAVRIEPRSGVMDSIRAALGWTRTHDETISIRADAVDEISSETVRLRAESMTELDETTDEIGRDVSTDDSIDSESGAGTDGIPNRGSSLGSPIDDEIGEDEPRDGRDNERTETVESATEIGDRDPTAAGAADASDDGGRNADEFEDGEPNETSEFESVDATDAMNAAEEPGAIDAPGNVPADEPPIDPEPTATPDEPSERDPATDSNVTEAAENGDEPTETSATEEMNLADELNTGIDVDSLEDAGGADDDRRSEGSAASDERDLTGATNRGIDIESAIDESGTETEREASDAESMDLADALDTGVDLASVVEPGDEAASKTSDAVDESDDGRDRSAAEIDPSVRAISAAEPDREANAEPVRESSPELGIHPETLAGRGIAVDPEIGKMTRRPSPDESAPTADGEDRSTADRSTPSKRSSGRDGRSSPVGATLDVQQTAMRAAFEGPVRVQRRSLELASAATRSYFRTIAAVSGLAGSGARDGRRVFGAADSKPDADEGARSRSLEDRREHVQELQERVEERLDRGNDRVADLLDRQVELLERYQQQLDRER